MSRPRGRVSVSPATTTKAFIVIVACIIAGSIHTTFSVPILTARSISALSLEPLLSPPPPILSDDFNDNALDGAKWNSNNLFSGYSNLDLPIAETGQRLEIGPLVQNVAGSSYRGVRSVNSYNFTGAYSHVELVQPASAATTGDAMFTIGNDVNAYYRIYVAAGTLYGLRKMGQLKLRFLQLPMTQSTTGSCAFGTIQLQVT